MSRPRKGMGAVFALVMVLVSGWVPAPAAAQSTVEYIHTDLLGSIAVVTDATANVIERREYEPYGTQLTPVVRDGPGYTGHVQDAATGLVYMQQRYYDSLCGCFLSVDPVTAYSSPISQFHRYRYANNNPYKFTDPDGRAVQALWGAPVGAAVEIIAQKIADPSAPINWKSVGVSTLVGAATGGIGSVARTAAVRGTITYSQAVTSTAAGNAAVSAAGSAADSSVNGESPNIKKMAVAAAVGGGLSFGTGRIVNGEDLRLERMSSAPVNSPQGIGIHVAEVTQAAGNASTSATQSAVSGVAGNAGDVAGSVVEKRVEERIR